MGAAIAAGARRKGARHDGGARRASRRRPQDRQRRSRQRLRQGRGLRRRHARRAPLPTHGIHAPDGSGQDRARPERDRAEGPAHARCAPPDLPRPADLHGPKAALRRPVRSSPSARKSVCEGRRLRSKKTRPLERNQFSEEAAENPVKNPAEMPPKNAKSRVRAANCTESCAIRQRVHHQRLSVDAQTAVQRRARRKSRGGFFFHTCNRFRKRNLSRALGRSGSAQLPAPVLAVDLLQRRRRFRRASRPARRPRSAPGMRLRSSRASPAASRARARVRGGVPRGAEGRAERAICSSSMLRIDRQDRRRRVLLLAERVDADDEPPALLDLALRGVGRVLDLPLKEALLDRGDRAAELVDLADERARAARGSRAVQASTRCEPPSGSTTSATPVSWAMTCCVRRASRADCLRGQRQRLVRWRWCGATASRRAPPRGPAAPRGRR